MSSPGLCWPLSPLPLWRSQGSASLIYVTAAVFRCCHSHIRWKTWYLKSCYTSTAYAGGKTIYILKKKKKILVKKELEQDYHSVSASHPQPSQCSTSPGSHFGTAVLPGFKAFVDGIDFVLFLWSGSQEMLLGDPNACFGWQLVPVVWCGRSSWDAAVSPKQPLSGLG